MKPLRIFIFFLAVLLLLLLVSLLFPKQGIGISGDLRLSFMSFSELIHEDSSSTTADVELLLAASTVTDDPESEENEAFESQVIPANVDSLKQDVYRIQFAEGNLSVLHPFFRNLDQIALGNKRHGRIVHFGD